MEENTPLSDLNYMLLSSPLFPGYLDTLAINLVDAEAAQVPNCISLKTSNLARCAQKSTAS
jgi:hypothetical protein